MMKCINCGKETPNWLTHCTHCNTLIYVAAERSEVLQGCPPSATGSARVGAVEEERARPGTEASSKQVADSSDRSARESGLVGVLWQGTRRDTCYEIGLRAIRLSHPQAAKAWRSLAVALEHFGEKDMPKFMDLLAGINAALAVGERHGRQPDAPPAAGERALARNAPGEPQPTP